MFHFILHYLLDIVYTYLHLVVLLVPIIWVGFLGWLVVDVIKNRKTPERLFINKF